MNEEIRKFLEKADHALTVAEDLMARGHAPDAASKIYYAMFYAARSGAAQIRGDSSRKTFRS